MARLRARPCGPAPRSLLSQLVGSQPRPAGCLGRAQSCLFLRTKCYPDQPAASITEPVPSRLGLRFGCAFRATLRVSAARLAQRSMVSRCLSVKSPLRFATEPVNCVSDAVDGLYPDEEPARLPPPRKRGSTAVSKTGLVDRVVSASFERLSARRCAPPNALCESPFPTSVVNTDAG